MIMSGFGSFSDDELSVAVDDIISQAKDLCELEQVAKINCSGFSGSDLPDELETRFRKLKSFPFSSKPRNPIDLENRKPLGECKGGSFTVDEKNPDGKPGLDEQGGSVSSGSGSSGFWADQVASDPRGSEKLFMDSPSPPRKVGCLWCSPKKVLKRMSIGSRSFDMGKKSEDSVGLGLRLGSFSIKEHEKIMRKMKKHDEKIAMEAEKIVEWAKQASARMSYHGADDDELTD